MHRRTLIATCILALIACLGNARAWGQMIVHAMTGTIRAVSTTELTTISSGVSQTFSLKPKSHSSLDFDKDLREDSTPAANFRKLGAFAVIYYYGYLDNKTAVAVKDLGAGPFERTSGIVKHFDKHNRRLTITNAAGKAEDFIIAEKAVVDTGMRAKPARKMDPPNGSHVRLTTVAENGAQTVIFLRLRR